MEPCAAVFMDLQRIFGLLRVIEISLHDSRSADAYLAFVSVRHLHFRACLDYLVICIRERYTDTAFFIESLWCQAAGCDALCGAVAFPDLYGCIVLSEEPVHFFLELHRKAVAA